MKVCFINGLPQDCRGVDDHLLSRAGIASYFIVSELLRIDFQGLSVSAAASAPVRQLEFHFMKEYGMPSTHAMVNSHR